MQTKPVSVLLVGIGGYGFYYLKTLLEELPLEKVRLRGVVEPLPEQSGYFAEIKERGIPIFSRIEDFYDNGYEADLAVISSPIHFHVPQSCTALAHGSNVLCEKPVAGTIQELDELVRTRDKSGKWVMIGYQWSFSRAIQSLKKDMLTGLFGKPIRLKTLCLWPRDDAYYRRNDWAGKIRDDAGRWILDSPVNNAMAHFLHNLFFILGNDIDVSASPKEVEAELYRANPIENYDTAVCRIYTTAGTELLFYGSHAVLTEKGPLVNCEFEDANISFGELGSAFVATDRHGRQKDYGAPDADHPFLKLFEAIETVTMPGPIRCRPEAARSQTLCMNGIQESVPEIVTFPPSMMQRNNEKRMWWVQGLDQALLDCYQKGVLPHEAHYGWAHAGKSVELIDYRYFPGNIPVKY